MPVVVNNLRGLPSVEILLQMIPAVELINCYGRSLTTEACRHVLAEIRSDYSPGANIPNEGEILSLIKSCLEEWTAPTLQPVINASGVILHTNLGRAPLSHKTMQAVSSTVSAYSTLEYNLAAGKRGSREIHAEKLLTLITGVEAAMVVNNNAAAVLLALTTLAHRRNVLISRTQLVEIGGGFRVPDVMKQSGAKLVEIGTTNRVHLRDYQNALEESSIALVMRAHHSNFKLIGFTAEPEFTDIIRVAHDHEVPVLDDLGSGALIDTTAFGLAHEPMVQESVAAGADIICFSGDKLLGGPQAGIIVGKRPYIEKMKKHPLARAIRPDKLCLAALSETLLHYLKEDALEEIPVWQMISTPIEKIHERAIIWQKALGYGEVIQSQSTVGGGSLPEETLPTMVLALKPPRLNHALASLRSNDPPVIARIENDHLLIDPRTVLSEQDPLLIRALSLLFNYR
jgi:L-seryl-tRNA(Ser) seleniumtransferase